MYEFWLTDRQGNRLLFSDVWSLTLGRELWRTLANGLNSNLAGFVIVGPDKKIAYEGDYTTDEC